MKVCIEKDEQGAFSVYVEAEPEGAEAQPQPARDLQSALMLAGKLLSQPEAPSAQPTPFDQGLQSVLPNRNG